MRHSIKVDTQHFDAVIYGLKKQETRANDRGYKVGDMLIGHECKDGKETLRHFEALVTHIVVPSALNQYGIKLWCEKNDCAAVIMSIKVIHWTDGYRTYKGIGQKKLSKVFK